MNSSNFVTVGNFFVHNFLSHHAKHIAQSCSLISYKTSLHTEWCGNTDSYF